MSFESETVFQPGVRVYKKDNSGELGTVIELDVDEYGQALDDLPLFVQWDRDGEYGGLYESLEDVSVLCQSCGTGCAYGGDAPVVDQAWLDSQERDSTEGSDPIEFDDDSDCDCGFCQPWDDDNDDAFDPDPDPAYTDSYLDNYASFYIDGCGCESCEAYREREERKNAAAAAAGPFPVGSRVQFTETGWDRTGHTGTVRGYEPKMDILFVVFDGEAADYDAEEGWFSFRFSPYTDPMPVSPVNPGDAAVSDLREQAEKLFALSGEARDAARKAEAYAEALSDAAYAASDLASAMAYVNELTVIDSQ